MSFDIPGYFLDKKTKKLFKITPHGPYSLPELRKRVQREEEEEAAAALVSKLNATRIQQPKNIHQFLRKRAGLTAPRNTSDITMNYLMTQFKTRSKIQLGDSIQKYNNMLVETTDDVCGEMFISSRLGLEHFGYELDPQFHIWRTDGRICDVRNSMSMKFLPHREITDGCIYRVLAGITGGEMWIHHFQQLPPLISDEIKQLLTEEDAVLSSDTILPTPVHSYTGYYNSHHKTIFKPKKDMFWSFDSDGSTTVIGGDKNMYHLDIEHSTHTSCKVKSSIFATHIPKLQPFLCWAGARNGKVSMMDWRKGRFTQFYLEHKFTQSSSISKIQQLNNDVELLTVSMDGSINIWDTRNPKVDQRESVPVFSLEGHVNEGSQFLGFDIDLENKLVMASGSDKCVRIWSYADQCNNGKPIWTSPKYAAPIPACKFKTTTAMYPKFQEGWTDVLDSVSISARQCPGILLFGTTENDNGSASVDWLTPVK